MDTLEARAAIPTTESPRDGVPEPAAQRLARRAAEREALSALIAHDLRNPLASVRFGAELLLHDPATPERVRFLAEQIIASTDGALALVASYLEPAVVREVPALVPVAVDAELRAALARAAPRAAPAAIRLRAPRLDRFDAAAAPALLAHGLDALLDALLERAPRGSVLVATLERVAPQRAWATFSSAAPPPSRELEQGQLRHYARLLTGRGTPEPGMALAQARFALHCTGAELYRIDAAEGSTYRVELEVGP